MESVSFFAENWFEIIGIDNDMRKYFFWDDGSVLSRLNIINKKYPNQYTHYMIDIRDEKELNEIFKKHTFDLIIHTAAQPSHDWATKEPLTDFSINANWTLLLLEFYRKYSPNATFIYTSTNKVYWDSPNLLPLVELETRYELIENHKFYKNGIDESLSIDNSLHSLFGVSKLSADIMVQEYWKNFWLHTGVFRCGCLTWPLHQWVQLHWFLSYLVKSIAENIPYTIFWYKWKQVRDNIHSYDLVNMFWYYYQNPGLGEVYNVWWSRHSCVSLQEAVKKIELLLNKKINLQYSPLPRKGDHIWYVSDISKFKNHYPQRNYKYSLDTLLEEMCKNI